MGTNPIERCAQFINVINGDIDLLALVLGKYSINIVTVEVPASDVDFESYVVCGFRHGKTNFATKLDL